MKRKKKAYLGHKIQMHFITELSIYTYRKCMQSLHSLHARLCNQLSRSLGHVIPHSKMRWNFTWSNSFNPSNAFEFCHYVKQWKQELWEHDYSHKKCERVCESGRDGNCVFVFERFNSKHVAHKNALNSFNESTE